MNSAARLLNQSTISRTWVVSIILTHVQYSVITLFLGVLVSALSIIYVTNMSRGLNANLQRAMAERNQLHIQESQLLLEKNTWGTQARIQSVATDKLAMEVPTQHSLVIIKSEN